MHDDPAPFPGRWWHHLDDGRVRCDLCPRDCTLADGQRGLCFVRRNEGGRMVLTTYGRSSGFCIDPIEKKPLNHFYPGSSVLSFGTAGCNLACKFCQNWDISKSREMDRLQSLATPDAIAESAVEHGCRSVAFTYNDPVIFAEYAMDTADACHARGLKTVAVTAGYVHADARRDFFAKIDAANVDLKGFTERFYHELSAAHLAPVLDTLRWLVHASHVWTEITTLVIPGQNDTEDELRALARWVRSELGPHVPLHFTAFHPDYRMLDVPPTPVETLRRAREIAFEEGLAYVYTGNVRDLEGSSTKCPGCGKEAIVRDVYDVRAFAVEVDAQGRARCRACGHAISGHFDRTAGRFGGRRLRVSMTR